VLPPMTPEQSRTQLLEFGEESKSEGGEWCRRRLNTHPRAPVEISPLVALCCAVSGRC
jgi:hypothetical protein